MMLLDLVDEMSDIRFAVFGDMVDTVNGLLAQPRCGLPIVIIQLAKVNLYKGAVGIQNVMNASKLWWNPEIPIAVEFKNGLAVHEIKSDVELSLIADRKRPVSMRDEFLKLYPKKSVGDIYEMLEEGLFIILATITDVVNEGFWWYTTCSCLRAVNFGKGFPYCDECKKIVWDMTPRYKFKVLVSDGCDNEHLIMFDSECYSLINKSCRDLPGDNQDNGSSSGDYLSEITALVGREVLFRIERKDDVLLSLDDSFEVKKVCTDTAIINEFKACANEDTPLKATEICSILSQRDGEDLGGVVHEPSKRIKFKSVKVEKVEWARSA
ncbi:hypothetical protein SESBI_23056 [Sesbania bispinosa]|nr:hypothetical protein SESBI_23056 [Sesbania bispinosa]